MNLTAALTALAGHYANHPELPGWHSIDNNLDDTIRVHIALGINERRPASRALIDWANTLINPTAHLKRFIAGWAGETHDQIHVHGHYSDGQAINVHHTVTGFGDYIGAPAITTVGETVDIPIDLDQLRAFANERRDIEFEVAA
ncbi:hypothetical protein [Saccharopolyspora tripterygii]